MARRHSGSWTVLAGMLWLMPWAWAGCGGGSGESVDDGGIPAEDAAEAEADGDADGTEAEGGDEVDAQEADADADADAGPDVVGECAPAGAPCGSAPRCCVDTICVLGVCSLRPARLGETCSAERPCGWLDGACRAGVCTCSGAGGPCAGNEECCPGEGPCVAGTCAGACAIGAPVEACGALPCCGEDGRVCSSDYPGFCVLTQDYIASLAPGCLGWGREEPCTSDEQCCPWSGPCVEGFCGRCLAAAAACTRDVDCCGGRCVGGTCAGASCVRRGQACERDADCCSPPCGGGSCGCHPPGSPCTRTEECCGGRCVAGACEAGCPDACSTDAHCCSGSHCIGGRCLPDWPTGGAILCSADVDCADDYGYGRARCDRGACQHVFTGPGGRFAPACAADSDCPPYRYCDRGWCMSDCGSVGGGCWNNGDCCTGFYCQDFVCVSCRPTAAGCASALECCSGSCAGGVCAEVCSPVGSLCMVAGDCCDAGAGCEAPATGGPQICCYPNGHGCAGSGDCCSSRCDAGSCAA